MDIYTIAKEEASIKRQKEILDRKIMISDMRMREDEMLKCFDELGIKYEKSRYYREEEERLNGYLDFRYNVFLRLDDNDDYVEVTVRRDGDYAVKNRPRLFDPVVVYRSCIIDLKRDLIERIKKANGC